MMSITTRSSREFNPKTAEAKRAALQGPVFITNRGQSTHVLLSFDGYQQLANIDATLPMPLRCRVMFTLNSRHRATQSLRIKSSTCADDNAPGSG